MTDTKKAYVKEWQKKHVIRVRVHKLIWYYKNRRMINMMHKITGSEPDEIDKWFAKKHPKG